MYQIYMSKQNLALNNLQGLVCHKIQPTNHWREYFLMCLMILLCVWINFFSHLKNRQILVLRISSSISTKIGGKEINVPKHDKWWMYLPTNSITSCMRHKISFLKQGIFGLNLEFSFSFTDFLIKTKDPSLPLVCSIKTWFMYFSRVIAWNETQPHPGFELELLIPFPAMITVLLRPPPTIKDVNELNNVDCYRF